VNLLHAVIKRADALGLTVFDAGRSCSLDAKSPLVRGSRGTPREPPAAWYYFTTRTFAVDLNCF